MRGGSYLIHSPWVLATLHGDYFTGGRGSNTPVIEHDAGNTPRPQNSLYLSYSRPESSDGGPLISEKPYSYGTTST